MEQLYRISEKITFLSGRTLEEGLTRFQKPLVY
jgi:hypothetical protein